MILRVINPHAMSVKMSKMGRPPGNSGTAAKIVKATHLDAMFGLWLTYARAEYVPGPT